MQNTATSRHWLGEWLITNAEQRTDGSLSAGLTDIPCTIERWALSALCPGQALQFDLNHRGSRRQVDIAPHPADPRLLRRPYVSAPSWTHRSSHSQRASSRSAIGHASPKEPEESSRLALVHFTSIQRVIPPLQQRRSPTLLPA